MTNIIRYSTSPAPWVPGVTLHKGECLEVLRTLPAESVSAVLTDPPYGLSDVSSSDTVQAITAWAQGDRERVPDGRGFMGHEWDKFVPPPAVWDECMRVLKPGGHMAVFAGSRTADLMGLSIRLAGFEMRDTITWMYSSGFPKSRDIGKDMDNMAGVTREVVSSVSRPQFVKGRGHGQNEDGSPIYLGVNSAHGNPIQYSLTAPATKEAKQWDGWGTALKPAGEPIIVARKPFTDTVANNVLQNGTGAMNINGCRVSAGQDYLDKCASVVGLDSNRNGDCYGSWTGTREDSSSSLGRWPANVVLSHGEYCSLDNCITGCPVAELNELSRFYPVFRYQAKAPKSERPEVNSVKHPTVKPLALIEWLVTLFVPPYGVILDPFVGSGTTGHAGLRLGFSSIVIERDKKYWPLIDQRMHGCLDALKVSA